MRFSEAIHVFTKHRRLEKEESTCHGYDLDLRQFCLYTHNPLITQIYIEQVVEYLTMMKELGWSQNSIMVKAVCFTQFFKFWRAKGYPVVNYELIPHVKRHYVEPKVANEDGLKKILELCDKYKNDPYHIQLKASVMLTADTGCRNGEICSFNLSALDTETCEKFHGFNQYSYIVKTEKCRGKKPFRRVFWYDETNDALKRWLEVRKRFTIKDKDALFIGLPGKGARIPGQRMTVCTFALRLRKISREAGIPHLNAHSIRHRFGNKLAAETGANNSVISDLMGHASLTSSFIYTHLNDDQLSKAHLKLKGKK